MASLWGTRRVAGRKSQFRAVKSMQAGPDLSIPTHFRCPISLELMRDPVTLPTGITYDRQSIETWLDMGNGTCPVTNRTVAPGQDQLVPNHALRRMIQDWCVAHREYGVERIPTPRIPATAAQVVEMLSEVAAAARRGDGARCREVVSRIRTLGKESERNRRCVASNGAAAVLSAAFGAFARDSNGARSADAKEEILAAVTGMFPLGEEACAHLGTPDSLRSIVWIAKCGGLAGRLNAVLVVKELVHTDRPIVDAVAGIDGMAEALVKLIREPISPQATKASLVAVFYLVSSDEKTASRFVDMGLVPLILEILVESDKSMTEKALGVLDGVCSSKKGRQQAYGHALTMPVLVKKIFRVSEVATEFSVSTLWKLCKNYGSEGEAEAEGERPGCLVEALQVGAFQKLLLLLQVGCGEATKEKASELLKLLNVSRGRLECIDSADFKALKRPF
ncbi:hypothetical protein Taro_055508 [Colocasia esculenta]|uniref:U-box domain-containing protein n=1 Tax=Colocasia esculenta TaxID=4460 RepID=A0A843XT60_COLES|nr:hypothetical protein [Colocasia esculenta]